MFWFKLLIADIVVIAIMLFLCRKSTTGSGSEDAMSDSLAGFVFWVVMAILFVANIASIVVHCL